MSTEIGDKATDLANTVVDTHVPEDYRPFGRQAV